MMFSNIYKSIISALVAVSLAFISGLSCFASVYFTDNEGSTIKHFAKSSLPTGVQIKLESGKIAFDFSARGDSSRSAYIYKQGLLMDSSFCFDTKLSFSNPSASLGYILLRNYYSGTGEYNLVTFDSGAIKVDGKKAADVPEGEFRLKALIENNILTVYVNGAQVASGGVLAGFSFSESLEVRVGFGDRLGVIGTTQKICLDDIKVIIDDDADSVYASETSYFADYGRSRVRKESTLDPCDSLTAEIMVANAGNEIKNIILRDRDTMNFSRVSLAPGDVKHVSVSAQNPAVGSYDAKEFLLWYDDGTITPITPKQVFANDGVVIPKISECKAMLSRLECGNIWLSKERILKIQGYINAESESYDEIYDEKVWKNIVSEGDALLTSEPMSYGKGLTTAVADEMYQRIALLSTLYLVYKDINPTLASKYANRAFDEMYAAIAFPDWNEAHFLDTAALLAGLAVGYDALSGMLSANEALKNELADGIYQKGIAAGLKVYREGEDSWETRKNNWNIICNSAMAMASIVLGADGKYVDDCAEAMNTALRELRLAYNNFSAYGSWNEGVSYWAWMLNFGVDLFQMLSNSFGTNFGYENNEKLNKSPYWVIAMSGAELYNNNDCDPASAFSSPRMFYFAELTGDKALGKFHLQHILKNGVKFRDAIWYDSSFADADASGIDEDYYDREHKLISFRDNFADNTYLAFNADTNLSTHTHLDMGGFVYDWAGVRWFEDLGIDDYDLYDYVDYNDYKWYYYRNRAEGHNCMVMDTGRYNSANPATAPDQVVDAEGYVTSYLSSQGISYAQLDISEAYAPSCNSFTRLLSLDKESKALIINDSFKLKDDTQTYWFAHTKANVEIVEDGKAAVLTRTLGGDEKKLYVKIVSGDGVFENVAATPLASSPNPDELAQNVANGLTQNKNTAYTKLCVSSLRTAGEHSLTVVAVPYENKDDISSALGKIHLFK